MPSPSKFNANFITIIILSLFLTSALYVGATTLNNRPIIGILAQPQTIELTPAYPNRQYIPASYVKWVEAAGARVVPIPWNIPADQARELMTQLNGLLLPGGDSVYVDTVDILLDIAIELNKNGIYFPVWGTCQGFEFLGIYFSGDRNFLGNFPSNDVALALKFQPDKDLSRFYTNMPQTIRNIFASDALNVTVNFHDLGIGLDSFQKHLAEQFYLISTNIDENGQTFVSTFEHKQFPIFGTQWHGERNLFEFGIDTKNGNLLQNNPHSIEAILASQYTINFFVSHCRQNHQKFEDWKIEQALLSYSYPKQGSGQHFVEKYWFDSWATGNL